MITLRSQKTIKNKFFTVEDVVSLYNSCFTKNDYPVNVDKLSFEDILLCAEKTEKDYSLIHLRLKKIQSLQSLAITPDHYEKLLKLITLILSYKRLQQGNIVYKCGEAKDDLFILFKGTADIIRATKIQVRMTEEEYMLYLTKLYYYQEKELLEKTVLVNNQLFNITSYSFKATIELYLKRLKAANPLMNYRNHYKIDEELKKLKPLHAETKIKFCDYFMYCLEAASKMDIRFCKNTITSIKEYIERIAPNYIAIATNEERSNYAIINKKYCYIYQYDQVGVLTEGYHFGQNFTFTDPQCTTIIIKEDAIIGKIHHYYSSIHMKDYILPPAHVLCRELLKNNIFTSLTMKVFMHIYLNYFSFHREYNGQSVIFSEGHSATKVYYIKSGEYEIYSKKSIEQLTALIKYYTIDTSIQTNDDESKYTEMDSEFFKAKYPMILAHMSGSDVLGFYDYTMNEKYTFSVKIKSNTAEYFSVDTTALTDMCMNNPSMYAHMNEYMNIKRKILLDKLIVFRKKFYQQYLMLSEKKETKKLIQNENKTFIVRSLSIKEKNIKTLFPNISKINSTSKTLKLRQLKTIRITNNIEINHSQSPQRERIAQTIPITESLNDLKYQSKNEKNNKKELLIETLHLDNQNQISIIKSPLVQSKRLYFQQNTISNDSFRKKRSFKNSFINQSTSTISVLSNKSSLLKVNRQPIRLVQNNRKNFTKKLNTLNDFWNHFGQSS